MPTEPEHRRRSRARSGTIAALGLVAVAVALWIWWSERHPQQERYLRVQLQEHLEDRFPATLQLFEHRYGVFPRIAGAGPQRRFRVLLVHGLDEPGSIWADLLPELGTAGFDTWEFRYPNDQGIDRSADLLASHWPDLPADLPVIMLGHSMGGLVIRDFVSRWRHPVAAPAGVGGASVQGIILAGTPNRGSEWARLRVWLELRDQWAAGQEFGFSLLSGTLDGTGAAKIDLQPGSSFLGALSARPWPEAVQVRIIGGILLQSIPALGDGVVAIDSLDVSGGPPPILVAASHRGMLTRMMYADAEPPAIPLILSLLDAFDGNG